MAITVKDKNGTSATGVTSTANAANSTASITVVGPKQTTTYVKGRGVYIKEVAGTYRWVRDEPLDASATEPTGFTHENNG